MSGMSRDEQVVSEFLAPLGRVEPATRRSRSAPAARRSGGWPYLRLVAIALGAAALLALIMFLSNHPSAAPRPAKQPAKRDVFVATRGWITYDGGDGTIRALDLDHPRHTRLVTKLRGTPVAWAQQGQALLVVGSDGDYVMGRDGRLTRIAAAPGANRPLGGGSFTPDGRRVIYEKNGSLFSVSVKGGHPTPIVRSKTADDPIYLLGDWSGGQLSPDGRELVYTEYLTPSYTSLRIGSINPDGTNQRTLVRYRDIVAAMGFSDWRHAQIGEIFAAAWFGDSSGLLIEADEKGGPCQVLAVDADGGHLRRWGPAGLCPYRSALSPSTGQLAFSTFTHHRAGFIVTDQAGHILRTVALPRNLRAPFFAWQPVPAGRRG